MAPCNLEPEAMRSSQFIRAVMLFGAFTAGSLMSTVFEWLQPITTIEITNASDTVIDHIDVEFRGNGEFQGRIAHGLVPGKTTAFKWITDGEASYRLAARFADGVEIIGGAGYTGRGRAVAESISKDKITSTEFSFPFMSSTRETTVRAHTQRYKP